jgi:hypothetical protein
MKLKSLLFIGALSVGTAASAQPWIPDTVHMGTGYVNDVFYALKDGAEKSEPSKNWHLAFQMTKFGDKDFNASISANHSNSRVEVYSLHMKASGGAFASISAADTVGKTSFTMQQINDTASWGRGAFMKNADPSNPFDFGWGAYDMTTHNLIGDSVYLIKVYSGSGPSATHTAYKLWLKKYTSTGTLGYEFEIAQLDNANDNNVTINRSPDYVDRLFAYYNITDNKILDREPGRKAWDMLFTRYPKAVISGGGPGLQAYTGVMTNLGVSVADVRVANATNLAWNDAQVVYDTTSLITIGDDWKRFDQPNMKYIVYDTINYFVKTPDLSYYQLRFKEFEFQGADAGRIIFEKRFLIGLNVKEITKNAVSTFAMVPNPASSSADIMIDAKESSNARLIVTDITGRIVENAALNLNKGVNGVRLNTANYTNGIYMVTVTNGSWKIAEKLVVQH